ncbi:hypothetical protein AB3M98_28015, partial [Mycolicibacterium litorale]
MLTDHLKRAPVLAAGASALAIAFAVPAGATLMFPAGGPPGCVDPYGTGCAAPPPPPPPPGAPGFVPP